MLIASQVANTHVLHNGSVLLHRVIGQGFKESSQGHLLFLLLNVRALSDLIVTVFCKCVILLHHH